MFRDATLHCLARAVDVGLIETVNAAAARFDPLTRRALRSSIRAALRNAAAATSVKADGDGEVHHLRLAFLMVAGKASGVAPDDVSAVAMAYAAAAVGYPRKVGFTFWPVTTAVLVAALVAAATTVAIFFRPTPEERFRKTALAIALAEPLTNYVVAIGKQQTPSGLARLQKSREQILTPAVKSQIGDEAAQQLGDVLLHAANVANVAPDAIENETKNLDVALSDLNVKLAKHKVRACLDAYMVARANGIAIWVLSYYAKRQVEVTVDGETSTVFWGSRLDDLNFTSGGGAYKSGEGRSVIVSLDDLEGEVLREILPALGGDGKLSLGGGAFESGATSTVPKAQRALTAQVRAEIAKAALIGDSMATEIAELVSRRDVALAQMRWEGRGGKKLVLSPKWSEDLRAMGDLMAKQVVKIDDRLASPDYVRAVARVVDAYALLQEEEFVGFLRAYKDKTLDSPTELKEIAGDSVIARATLASRLAVLARPRAFAFAELARIAEYAMSTEYSASSRRGALLLFAAVARELGVAADGWTSGPIDRDALADAITQMTTHGAEELRAASERAYQKLFIRPVPKLERRAL